MMTNKALVDQPQTHVLLGPIGDLLKDIGPGERLNRVQALLAQWLRMENVVVLLGTGKQVALGIRADLRRARR